MRRVVSGVPPTRRCRTGRPVRRPARRVPPAAGRPSASAAGPAAVRSPRPPARGRSPGLDPSGPCSPGGRGARRRGPRRVRRRPVQRLQGAAGAVGDPPPPGPRPPVGGGRPVARRRPPGRRQVFRPACTPGTWAAPPDGRAAGSQVHAAPSPGRLNRPGSVTWRRAPSAGPRRSIRPAAAARPPPTGPPGAAPRAARSPRSWPAGRAPGRPRPPPSRPASRPGCSPRPRRCATRGRPPPPAPPANPPARPASARLAPLPRARGGAGPRRRSASPTVLRVTPRPGGTGRATRLYGPRGGRVDGATRSGRGGRRPRARRPPTSGRGRAGPRAGSARRPSPPPAGTAAPGGPGPRTGAAAPPPVDVRRIDRAAIEKAQADYPRSRRWGGARRIGYHRRDGVARAGRLVPATAGRPDRRNRMSDTPRRPTPPAPEGGRPAAGVGPSAGRPAETTPRTPRPAPRPTPRGHRPQGGRP